MRTLKNMRKYLRSQTMTEYAIIIALIALACIGAINYLTGGIKKTFTDVGTELGSEEDEPE